MKGAPNERLAALEQRLSDHEARCEERLGEIKASAASTLKAVEGLRTRSWGLVAALLAWALAQVWTANQGRLDRLEAAAPVVRQAVTAAASRST
jgi:hypothetical protein